MEREFWVGSTNRGWLATNIRMTARDLVTRWQSTESISFFNSFIALMLYIVHNRVIVCQSVCVLRILDGCILIIIPIA